MKVIEETIENNKMLQSTKIVANKTLSLHTNGISVCKIPSTEAEVREIWRNADAVCFDVDSTVCEDEGIDELAEFLGKSDEVIEITHQAMSGNLDFHQALMKRLEIIHPSLQEIQSFIRARPPRLTPGIRELIAILQKRGTQVYLVSGGFMSVIKHVGAALNIPTDNIFCNRLKFYYDGRFSGFEENALTAHSGGKREIIRMLKEKHQYKRIVMVGDGATDMETCPPADAFVGFGGNAIREAVKKGSKLFVTSFQELIDELKINYPSYSRHLSESASSSSDDGNGSSSD